jgi:hypothetical protein
LSSHLPPTPVHSSSLLTTHDAYHPGTGFPEEELGFVNNAWSSSNWDWTSDDQALHTLDYLPIGITSGTESIEMIPSLHPHQHPDLSVSLESLDDFHGHDRPPVSSSSSSPPRIDETELRVRQLSDLTSRLYVIYRASCGLNVPRNEHSGPPITPTVFEAVTALFQEKPSLVMSSALDESFTACRTLLDILIQLLGNVSLGGAGNRTEPTHHQPLSIIQLPVDPGANHHGTETGTGGDSQEPVLYHMTTTCYNLLLLIHINLISALQRDAILHTSRVATSGLSISPSSSISVSMYSAPSMVELQLILLVQVMTYFLDRLQQTMSAYSVRVTRRQRYGSLDRSMEALDESIPYQMAPPDTISTLENRARSKLNQLRRVLSDARTRN